MGDHKIIQSQLLFLCNISQTKALPEYALPPSSLSSRRNREIRLSHKVIQSQLLFLHSTNQPQMIKLDCKASIYFDQSRAWLSQLLNFQVQTAQCLPGWPSAPEAPCSSRTKEYPPSWPIDLGALHTLRMRIW